jgi:hypothetical protein
MTEQLEDRIKQENKKIHLNKILGMFVSGSALVNGGYMLLENALERANEKAIMFQTYLSKAKEITPETYKLASNLVDQNIRSPDNVRIFFSLVAGAGLAALVYYASNKENT